jgi:predicted nucleotidyltransferase
VRSQNYEDPDARRAVLLFGSLARGESTETSDIDLAVIAPDGWTGRGDLQATVEKSCGNPCDVLVMTENDLVAESDVVTRDIMRDGIALVGRKPDRRRGTA